MTPKFNPGDIVKIVRPLDIVWEDGIPMSLYDYDLNTIIEIKKILNPNDITPPFYYEAINYEREYRLYVPESIIKKIE